MHSVTDRRTDRRTDGQQDDANSRSYCVAVRSAKNWVGLGKIWGPVPPLGPSLKLRLLAWARCYKKRFNY